MHLSIALKNCISKLINLCTDFLCGFWIFVYLLRDTCYSRCQLLHNRCLVRCSVSKGVSACSHLFRRAWNAVGNTLYSLNRFRYAFLKHHKGIQNPDKISLPLYLRLYIKITFRKQLHRTADIIHIASQNTDGLTHAMCQASNLILWAILQGAVQISLCQLLRNSLNLM